MVKNNIKELTHNTKKVYLSLMVKPSSELAIEKSKLELKNCVVLFSTALDPNKASLHHLSTQECRHSGE